MLYLKDEGEFLKDFLQNGRPPNSIENVVGFLQNLAKVRFALNATVEILSETDNGKCLLEPVLLYNVDRIDQ